MTRREWAFVIAVAALMLLSLWMNYHSQQAVQRSLDGISQQLDAKEQARIDMLEARIISNERVIARLQAELEGD